MMRALLCCSLLVSFFVTSVRSQTTQSSETRSASDSKPKQPNTHAPEEAPDAKPSGNSSQSPQNKEPDSTKLQAIKLVKPVYPEEAREKQLQGQVLIKLMITETGDVEKTEIVKGDPVLGKAAEVAFKQWKFKPYIRDGKAVKVSTTLPYDFAFKSNVIDIPATQHTTTSIAPDGSKTSSTPSNDAHAPSPSGIETAGHHAMELPSNVTQGLLLHKVQPVYPEDARQHWVEGTVVLRAIIGKDGRIANLTAVSGNPKLISAAIGAVQQWRYKPFLVEGKPVEVDTKITVNFQLTRR